MFLLKTLWRNQISGLIKIAFVLPLTFYIAYIPRMIQYCPCLFQKLRSHSQHCPLNVISLLYVIARSCLLCFQIMSEIYLLLSLCTVNSVVLHVYQFCLHHHKYPHLFLFSRQRIVTSASLILLWNSSVMSSVDYSPQTPINPLPFSALLWIPGTADIPRTP
jgi:hypothetical protein